MTIAMTRTSTSTTNSGCRRFVVGHLVLGVGLGALGLELAGWVEPAATRGAGLEAASADTSAGSTAPSVGSTAAGAGPTAASADSPASSAPEIASYSLEARLDTESHVITGKGTLSWTNASREPARELFFHLYLNAFKNDRTLFLRSPFGAGRSGEHAREWGYIDVARLSVRELGGVDLWPGAEKTSPGDPDDQTDIRVPLPSEIAPGRAVSIDLEWTSKLPSIVERTGYSGKFHMMGHWFPKLARREPDGSWAHFAFHPHAEFYADFGHYEVRLDVPLGTVVGATGRLVEEHVEKERRLLRYQAAGVHDFAWTAWEDFQERRERIDDVEVRVLFPPGGDGNAEATLGALRVALPRMSRLYGRYPHPALTVVHPPAHAEGAGGMEYPTLITTGGPWWVSRSGIRMVEAVTVHELGHQWFQGIVASNEEKWPFLDEGVTSWVEAGALRAAYGTASLVSLPGLALSDISIRRIDAISAGHDDPVAQPASRFASFRSIGAIVYSRTATVLETLARVYGRDALDSALGAYARRQRFGHPEPHDLIDVVRERLGSAAAENLHAALFEKGWVDYTVDDLDCTESLSPAGIFDREGGRATTERARPSGDSSWDCRVLVRRHGTLRFPVEVELGFDDGKYERRSWDGAGSFIVLDTRDKRKIVAANLDPDRKVLLDESFSNNARRARRDFGHRTLERAVYLGELLLGWLGP